MPFFQAENLNVEIQGGDQSAVLTLDAPGRNVNVLGRKVLADLETALDRLAEVPSLKFLGIRSAKPASFIAGADLHELAAVGSTADAIALSAVGQRAFDKLANLPMPTLVQLEGPCLGGGLEFALACDYRLVVDHPKTQFGLPEIELGLLPAWGGTQRLPRVIGLERALRVILAGHRMDAREAFRWGFADVLITKQDTWSAALAELAKRAQAEGKRPKDRLPLRTWRQRLLESTGLGRRLIFKGAERVIRRRVPDDMPAPLEALKAVRVGLSKGMPAGLAYEREAVGRLGTTPACRNLVNLFFAREQARKLPEKLPAGSNTKISRVGVVGAGTMGAGIAQLALLKGAEVVVQEVDDTALGAGVLKIAALLQKAAERGMVSKEEMPRRLSAVRGTTKWEGFADLDLVIEAALEDLEAKRAIFRTLEEHTSPTTILATNTSSLAVEQLQEGLSHPERVAGLHFFNPVHKMPLVEVVRAPKTDESIPAVLARWAASLGKTPVIVKDCPGFLVNRILLPYLNEAVLLVAEGMAIEHVDQAMRRFGMPMGPLEMLDQVGLDVAAHIARAMKPIFGKRFAMNPAFERMYDKGWLGQKSGLGFYRYQGKSKKVHAEAAELLGDGPQKELSALSSLPPATQSREARERMVLSMVNEAASCLGEGLAADAATIDLAMVLGTGWAPHRGGPLRYAHDRGLIEVIAQLTALTGRLGPRFEPSAELRRLAEEGSKLLKS